MQNITQMAMSKYKKYVVGLGIPAVLALAWHIIWSLIIHNSPPDVRLIQCEGEVNPITVNNLTPRLSWITFDSDHNSSQSRAVIQVGTQPDTANLWDFEYWGEQDNVIYNLDGRARELEWGKRYYWRVRVWDNKNKPSISWHRGYFQLIDKKIPVSTPEEKPIYKPKEVMIPGIADVKFSSKLTSLLDENTIQSVQQDVKKAVVRELQKRGEILEALEIIFKEQFDRSGEKLVSGKSYQFEMAVFIKTKSNRRIVTAWYAENNDSALKAIINLTIEIQKSMTEEINNWL